MNIPVSFIAHLFLQRAYYQFKRKDKLVLLLTILFYSILGEHETLSIPNLIGFQLFERDLIELAHVWRFLQRFPV